MNSGYKQLDEIVEREKKRKIQITEKNKQHIRKSNISPILKFIYLYMY